MKEHALGVSPALSVLSEEQIQEVHQRSVEVLSTAGIRVDSSEACAIFQKADGVSVQDNRVRLYPEIIDWALSVVPISVLIYDRLGDPAFSLEASSERRTVFGIGVTNLFYQEVRQHTVTPFLRRHMVEGVRLGNSLSEFDCISTLGVPQDLQASTADLFAALDMLANTLKPLVLLVSNDASFEPALDLLEHLQGDLAKKPWVLPYVNPITPLVLNDGTVQKLRAAIQRGLPVIYNNYGMAGASTPITALGSLIVLNAELLAGLVFSQLIREKTPIILGSLPAVFDMRAMISAYSGQTMLLNLACAEMMDHYQVPHSGTSGSCNGWGADLSAAGTLWLNHLTGCLGTVGMAPFVGGNFDSMAFSPSLVVYANEVIRQAREFSQGFVFAEGQQELEEILNIGPGGDFLYSDRTFALCREGDSGQGLWPNLSLEAWTQQGSPAADHWLQALTEDLMARAEAPEDHQDILARGEEYIQKVLRQLIPA